MTHRCPYCDQTLLEDETECWQCGRQVEAQALALANAPRARDGWQQKRSAFSLSALTVYSAITALVVAVVLVATILLGRQPRLQAGANSNLPEGWVWLKESGNDFLLFLPESWQFRDPSTTAEETSLTGLVAGEPAWAEATAPLAALAEDMTYIFMAEGAAPPADPAGRGALLFVARSRLLNQLPPAELATLLPQLAQESGVTLISAEAVVPVPGIEFKQLALVVDLARTADGVRLRCRQQLIPGKLDALLVSSCTLPEPGPQSTIRAIMDSFQRLDP